MVNILTDSTADLGQALTEKHHIQTVPLYVTLADKVYSDGVNINNTLLFQSVKDTGQLPKTSAPSVMDFQKYFEQPGETVYIGLSSQLSATVQNALQAQETCPPGKVFVIDSLNLSTGIGLLALKACDLRDAGLEAVEIDRQVKALIPKIRTSFVVETLEYIYKGGRCSAVENLMGTFLHIRPVINVRPDGTLGVKGRTRGSRQKAFDFMLDDFRDNLPEIDLQRVFITHTGCDADADYLKQELLKIAPIQNIYITMAGSVIASHCGPDTIGILYMLK